MRHELHLKYFTPFDIEHRPLFHVGCVAYKAYYDGGIFGEMDCKLSTKAIFTNGIRY